MFDLLTIILTHLLGGVAAEVGRRLVQLVQLVK